MTTASDYERILLVKPEVHVFRIPPRTTNRGYRAADWKLDSPDWISRMKVMAIGKKCFICIEDKNSGELFAKAPIPSYPGEAVESVLDSSRYFVIRIEDESGKKAFIGIGFQDRADSFDFNVALQDHFKHLKQEQQFEAESKKLDTGPKLDLGFKEGQTITINIGKKDGASKPRSRPTGAAASGGQPPLLLPPPGVKPLGLPPQAASQEPPAAAFNQSSSGGPDLFGASSQPFNNPSQPAPAFSAPPQNQAQQGGASDWGDFTSAKSSSNNSSNNWVQF
ncbi:adaptin ear-binding coat-associated protein 2-like [Apostichopus japonicus]|uniref:adaptin ear-binding coat-associated protein 2-like n=1 Tax=Stichopus japonicus TaxID=307972 RepID=UPI003AB6FFC7